VADKRDIAPASRQARTLAASRFPSSKLAKIVRYSVAAALAVAALLVTIIGLAYGPL
jgi:hypothetical protein